MPWRVYNAGSPRWLDVYLFLPSPSPYGYGGMNPVSENATKEPWWVHHADHMKGWEAFGITGRDGDPIVRRLGTVTYPKKGQGPSTDEKPGTTPFGSGEVRLGVAGIEFSTHADSPDTAFLHVLGTTERDVRERWALAEAVFADAAARLWPLSRPLAELGK